MGPGVGAHMSVIDGIRTLSGGNGSQVLRGTDGRDLILGDSADGAVFEARDEARGAGGVARGLGDVALIASGGSLLAFAAASGRGAGGAQGFAIDLAADALSRTWSQEAMWYGPDDMLTGAPAIAACAFQGSSWLVTAGLGLSVARIGADGAPGDAVSIDWDWGDGLLRPGALAAWTEGSEMRILAAGGEEGGLVQLRWTGTTLSVTARIADSVRELGDVSDIDLTEIGGQRFAVIASRDEDEISVWKLGAGAPRLTDLRGTGDGESRLDLTEVEAVEIVEIGGARYVFAAAPDRLVAYALDATGALARVGAVEGATALAAVELGGAHLLFAGDGDMIRVHQIAESGRLDQVDAWRLDWGAEIASLEAAAMGDRVALVVGRSDAAGHDLLTWSEPGDDDIDAGAGDDEVHGGGGNDLLRGGAGNDALHGEAGDDRLLGDAGADLLDGGEGADTLTGGGGEDRLLGGAGDDALGVSGVARTVLRGGEGDDRLAGALGADRMFGDADDDVLFGDGGKDRIKGGEGRDQIDGGVGDDRLWGADGADRIEGGAGADRIWGGAGKDVFVFGALSGADHVLDFGGKDRIRLETVHRFGELEISAGKADVIVDWKDGHLVLHDVSLKSIDASDFIFG